MVDNRLFQKVSCISHTVGLALVWYFYVQNAQVYDKSDGNNVQGVYCKGATTDAMNLYYGDTQLATVAAGAAADTIKSLDKVNISTALVDSAVFAANTTLTCTKQTSNAGLKTPNTDSAAGVCNKVLCSTDGTITYFQAKAPTAGTQLSKYLSIRNKLGKEKGSISGVEVATIYSSCRDMIRGKYGKDGNLVFWHVGLSFALFVTIVEIYRLKALAGGHLSMRTGPGIVWSIITVCVHVAACVALIVVCADVYRESLRHFSNGCGRTYETYLVALLVGTVLFVLGTLTQVIYAAAHYWETKDYNDQKRKNAKSELVEKTGGPRSTHVLNFAFALVGTLVTFIAITQMLFREKEYCDRKTVRIYSTVLAMFLAALCFSYRGINDNVAKRSETIAILLSTVMLGLTSAYLVILYADKDFRVEFRGNYVDSSASGTTCTTLKAIWSDWVFYQQMAWAAIILFADILLNCGIGPKLRLWVNDEGKIADVKRGGWMNSEPKDMVANERLTTDKPRSRGGGETGIQFV